MYGSKTLLGNYSEDRTHAELLAKDYQLKKQRGELLTLKQQRQESIMMQTVRVGAISKSAASTVEAACRAFLRNSTRHSGTAAITFAFIYRFPTPSALMAVCILVTAFCFSEARRTSTQCITPTTWPATFGKL